jgi:NADH:ubiquinone oxidoreductase subunit C
MLFLKNKENKLTKYSYIYLISLTRFISPLINQINVQNYYNKKVSSVDYFLYINEKTMNTFFLLISQNLIYTYEQLINITCIDNLNLSNDSENSNSFKTGENRLTLIYILNNINTTSRLIISLSFSLGAFIVSLSEIYKASIWLEREIYDLFGVFFSSHPDLRRLVTDYGFKGNPLRKDFPLTGYLEVRYNEELKSVKYKTLKLMQEYRFFHCESPWTETSNLKNKYEIF